MSIFNFWKKAKPESEKASRTMILNTETGSAHWPERNYQNFAQETYMKNTISFRCIFYIASSLASVKWGIFTQSGNKKIEVMNHPVNRLIKRANPKESFVFLIQKLISFLLISGNSYLEKVAPSSGIPKELYVLRPDKIIIKTNQFTGQIEKYVYDQKIDFEVDPITQQSDILHFKAFHPLNDFFGLSITEPIAREVDSSNEATEWQKKVFENEGRPGMAVFVHGFLTDDQWDRLESQLKSKHGGAKNAGKSIVIEGDGTGDIKPYSWSPKEMDWLESNRELSRKICIGYGVPPMLLGIPGDNTYSNMKEAREAFWEETIIYYLDLIKGEINNWIFSEDEQTFLDYDLSQISALAGKQEKLWERMEKATFLTINEKREAVGYDTREGGDVILIPMGMTTLDQLVLDQENANENPELDQSQEDDELKKLISSGYTEDEAQIILGVKY